MILFSSSLNYFLPYNRYTLNLIATQTFSNQLWTKSSVIVQINLENYNIHARIFIPSNQIFFNKNFFYDRFSFR